MFWKHNIFGSTTVKKLGVLEGCCLLSTKFSAKLRISGILFRRHRKQDGNQAGREASTMGAK
ncbi:hypothetical protein F2Q70_00030237 [Brassica cretica]|uniref:Uncharacterized protein n=1 Tax=Brassica cretica TaxID=69181 RepID=A0A8S9FP80_BRACR|nr:hypothetical protein F2Q70_00030237 [Brassica cretica]